MYPSDLRNVICEVYLQNKWAEKFTKNFYRAARRRQAIQQQQQQEVNEYLNIKFPKQGTHMGSEPLKCVELH